MVGLDGQGNKNSSKEAAGWQKGFIVNINMLTTHKVYISYVCCDDKGYKPLDSVGDPTCPDDRMS